MRTHAAAAGHAAGCTCAELRRHKRSFLRLATKITFSRLSDAAAAQRLFVDFLNQQLGGSGG